MSFCLKKFVARIVLFYLLSISVNGYNQSIFNDTIIPGTKVFYRTDTVYYEELIDGDLKTIRQINIFDTAFTVLPIKPKRVEIPEWPIYLKSTSRIKRRSREKCVNGYLGLNGGFGSSLLDRSDTTTQNISKGYSNLSNISIGGGITIQRKRFSIDIGARISHAREKESFARFYTKVDTAVLWDVNERDTMVVIADWVFQYTMLPDSVFYIDTSHQIVTVLDSTMYFDFDSTRVTQVFSKSNRFAYVEFPVLFGYEFFIKYLQLTLQGGICASWLIKPYGHTVDRTYGIRQLKTDYFHQLTVDLLIGAKLKYPFSLKQGLYLKPFVRYPLVKQYNSDLFISKKIFYVGFGLGYYFSLY